MRGAERIIDANLNRAREALRVLEDVARFALDDAVLCSALKSLRHDLREATDVLQIDRLCLVAHRDTDADVGTGISTGPEMRREGLQGVAVAAGARLTEALRSIEEAVKTLPGARSGIFESLRYRAYTLEKSLILAVGTGACAQWRLCVLITTRLCIPHSWERVAELATEAGADCLQLREKELADREILRMARRLVAIAHPRHARVIVNDRPDLALLSGADGVHVGQGDLPLAEVRKLCGGRLLVGASTADVQQARLAASQGADYCGVGPIFATTTKVLPAIGGVACLAAYLADPAAARIPHLAIGGISPDNIHALVDAGCRGVAVSSAVCGARDPAAVCRELLGALDGAPARPR